MLQNMHTKRSSAFHWKNLLDVRRLCVCLCSFLFSHRFVCLSLVAFIVDRASTTDPFDVIVMAAQSFELNREKNRALVWLAHVHSPNVYK